MTAQVNQMAKQADVIITIAVLVPKLKLLTSAARFIVIERPDAAPIVEDNVYDINSDRQGGPAHQTTPSSLVPSLLPSFRLLCPFLPPSLYKATLRSSVAASGLIF